MYFEVRLGFDLVDLIGYVYYSGVCFVFYVVGSSDVVLCGGCYDEVGVVFGCCWLVVGFSVDLKILVVLSLVSLLWVVICVFWGEDVILCGVICCLCENGEMVVCMFFGYEYEGDEFDCDCELV